MNWLAADDGGFLRRFEAALAWLADDVGGAWVMRVRRGGLVFGGGNGVSISGRCRPCRGLGRCHQADARRQVQAMLWARACQADRFDPVDAAHDELGEAAVAGLGVDPFRESRSLLVDGLGRRGRHASSPPRHFRRVVRAGRVAVAAFVAGRRHRRKSPPRPGSGPRCPSAWRSRRRPDAGAAACHTRWPGRRSSAPSCPCPSRGCPPTDRPPPRSWCRRRTGHCRPAGSRRRPSSSPGPRHRWSKPAALSAGSGALAEVSPPSAAPFLAARSARLRARSCCSACNLGEARASATRRSRSSAARLRAAVVAGRRLRDRRRARGAAARHPPWPADGTPASSSVDGTTPRRPRPAPACRPGPRDPGSPPRSSTARQSCRPADPRAPARGRRGNRPASCGSCRPRRTATGKMLHARRASARALPIPATVAYSHSATRMRGSAGGCPGRPSTALMPA